MTAVPDSLGKDHRLAEKKLARLVETGLLLSREKDHDLLLKNILFGTRDIAQCAAATLYLKTKHNTLAFSLRTNGEILPMSELAFFNSDGMPNERFVATYAALHNKTVRIDDVYQETRFDLSGTRQFSEESGFRTISMLVVPLSPNSDEVLGVLQLLNALDDSGNVIAFPQEIVSYVEAIASQSAIALENQRLLETQRTLIEQLNRSEHTLEEAVEARTIELKTTLNQLMAAQNQLVQAEKMASLGQLVASVAHEINNPIAAVKSSGDSINGAIDQLLASQLQFVLLDFPTHELFAKLLGHVRTRATALSSREERAIVREVTRELERNGMTDAHAKASLIVQLNAQAALSDYLPLLQHSDCKLILNRASNIAAIINHTANINTAVDRASKIVCALKSYSRRDKSGAMVLAKLQDGMDTVLTIYQSQIKRVAEVILDYQDVPELPCLPDELNQVWTNLIHNALQAMQSKGILSICIRQQGDEAVVSVADTGGGIPIAILPKIFDPFFTTKPIGEGSGLGLDIARKIVEKHHGRIEVQNVTGIGVTFLVYLPLTQPA